MYAIHTYNILESNTKPKFLVANLKISMNFHWFLNKGEYLFSNIWDSLLIIRTHVLELNVKPKFYNWYLLNFFNTFLLFWTKGEHLLSNRYIYYLTTNCWEVLTLSQTIPVNQKLISLLTLDVTSHVVYSGSPPPSWRQYYFIIFARNQWNHQKFHFYGSVCPCINHYLLRFS